MSSICIVLCMNQAISFVVALLIASCDHLPTLERMRAEQELKKLAAIVYLIASLDLSPSEYMALKAVCLFTLGNVYYHSLCLCQINFI